MIAKFTTRLPEELKVKSKIIAKKRGYPLNGLILQLLWDCVSQEESKGR